MILSATSPTGSSPTDRGCMGTLWRKVPWSCGPCRYPPSPWLSCSHKTPGLCVRGGDVSPLACSQVEREQARAEAQHPASHLPALDHPGLYYNVGRWGTSRTHPPPTPLQRVASPGPPFSGSESSLSPEPIHPSLPSIPPHQPPETTFKVGVMKFWKAS